MIEKVITTGYMPPWPADPTYRTFLNEKTLSKEEINTIINWVQLGKKEGEQTNNNIIDSIMSRKEKKADLRINMHKTHVTNNLNKLSEIKNLGLPTLMKKVYQKVIEK